MMYTIKQSQPTTRMINTAVLNLNGKTRSLSVDLRYYDRIKKWTMTVSDAVSGECLVSNVPIIVSSKAVVDGVIYINDLFRQFEYMGLGTMYAVDESAGRETDPDSFDMSSVTIYWGDSVE